GGADRAVGDRQGHGEGGAVGVGEGGAGVEEIPGHILGDREACRRTHRGGVVDRGEVDGGGGGAGAGPGGVGVGVGERPGDGARGARGGRAARGRRVGGRG